MSFRDLSAQVAEEFAAHSLPGWHYAEGESLWITDSRSASVGDSGLSPRERAIRGGKAAASLPSARWRHMTSDDFRAMAARHPGYRSTPAERVRRKNDLRNVRRRTRTECRKMGRPAKMPIGTTTGHTCHGVMPL